MAKPKTQVKYKFPESLFSAAEQFKKAFFKPMGETVIDGQVVVVKKFFSVELCNELIKSFEKLKLETTPLVKSKEYAARVNDRTLVEDLDAARSLWDYLSQVLLQENYDENELKSVFGNAIGLNPQLRVYRYVKGHYFGKHYDEAVKALTGETKWTLLIYLTGDEEFEGGGTIFYENRKCLNIHPSKGMALLHKHGDSCLLHEAELVKRGVKWVLRSDVVF